MTHQTEVLVLGSGPAGYTAAFRAADLGKKVTIVEKYDRPGGVCLNVGCIPSKFRLHISHTMQEAKALVKKGINFGEPTLDLETAQAEQNKTTQTLTDGLLFLMKKRGVKMITGTGHFKDARTLEVTDATGKTQSIKFEQAVIAAGSSAIMLPSLPKDPRIMTSTGALTIKEVPERLLIIGGGIIGLEMTDIYHALGSKITIVELGNQLVPAADADLVKPLHKRMNRQADILLETKVTKVTPKEEGLLVEFEGKAAPKTAQYYDRILCAIGRTPNGHKIGASNAGIELDARNFIKVDKQMRTNVPHIFAIGDIVGQPMLAHKGSAEAKIAAEVITGHDHKFEPLCIPSVAYTEPGLAWVGLTEKEAVAKNIPYKKGVFPWSASGRALTQNATDGITKLLFDPKTKRVIGGGIVGAHAGELISEITLAIEMGANVEDMELTIHPHPTLSETVLFSAEMFGGTITDLLPPKEA